MSNQEYLGKFMYLYFVIIPFLFSIGLMVDIVLEKCKEHKKRKKLEKWLSNEND